MLTMRWIRAFMVMGLVLVLQGCAETSTQRMINASDQWGAGQLLYPTGSGVEGKGEGVGGDSRELR